MTAAVTIAAFGLTAIFEKFLLPVLRAEKVRQTERDDGPESHKKKTGTPTMGGIAILAGVLVASLAFGFRESGMRPALVLAMGFGITGFVDDFIKARMRRSLGLRAWQKLAMQLVITIVFYIMLLQEGYDLSFTIPFTGGNSFELGTISGAVLIFLAVLGTTNGTNFTDGVDGLLSSVTIPVALFLYYISNVTGSGTGILCCAFAGAFMGFLLFNAHPAAVFMGDTGSLAAGGFVAGVAVSCGMTLYIPIFGVIYLIEVLSVMIQVLYFKKTKGKRFFRMAPIHHHFELGGWSETRVVTVFTVVSALACLLAAAAAW
ncbi:MAG: phospho-N-acetylmuramoyl-pentapeptide-transferase [Lachnospiraceae bacterium]|nr:phospho-N-acetylmuramoyl-pentapeptide-transferase [Lachnospiraceae bacterium]